MPDQPGLPNKGELENSPLFRGVELETIIGLLQACAVQELKQGEVLVHGGQLSHSLFLVLAGRLCVQFKVCCQRGERLLTNAPLIVYRRVGEDRREAAQFDLNTVRYYEYVVEE